MGFLRKLFGGGKKQEDEYVDKNGIYFYVQVDNLNSRVKVRADKQYDLMSTDSGYVWHKTIVDSKYFRRMNAVVHFDRSYNITNAEIEGGAFISQEEYEAREAAQRQNDANPTDAESTDDET